MREFLVLVIVTLWLNYPPRREYYLSRPISLMVKMLILEYFLLIYWLIYELF